MELWRCEAVTWSQCTFNIVVNNAVRYGIIRLKLFCARQLFLCMLDINKCIVPRPGTLRMNSDIFLWLIILKQFLHSTCILQCNWDVHFRNIWAPSISQFRKWIILIGIAMSRSKSQCQNKIQLNRFLISSCCFQSFMLPSYNSWECVFWSYTQHNMPFTSSVSYSSTHGRHVSIVSESKVVSTLWSLNYEILSQNYISPVMEVFCWWSHRKDTGTWDDSMHPARSQHSAKATCRTREKR